uniref:Uncharacterized protein n=1 Tax=Bionectria ochroleuca TaxID=29856 RepID=A0A0B7K3H0_BIOOC
MPAVAPLGIEDLELRLPCPRLPKANGDVFMATPHAAKGTQEIRGGFCNESTGTFVSDANPRALAPDSPLPTQLPKATVTFAHHYQCALELGPRDDRRPC